jgi:hypothetical protein
VIVVVGSPIAQPGAQGLGVTGLGAAVARAAVALGSAVQLVGRVGEDAAGDAILLALAAAGVDHVAVLREPGRPTPSAPPQAGSAPSPDGPILGEAMLDDADDELVGGGDGSTGDGADRLPAGLSMDAADLELALRYLPDYRVVVLAADLEPPALATVVAAAGWAGAQLVALVAPTDAPATNDLPADATVFERPAGDPDGAFARVVAAYAVALDQGREPRAAFDSASGTGGWSAVPS